MLFHTPPTYGSDRFRQIFLDHWDRWYDLHQADLPSDQQAYVCDIIQKMMGCRNPQSGYARYVCPGCGDERLVPFSCKTRFCPSCGKVRTDEWVNHIAQELLDVPHLHLTLTVAQELRETFYHDRRLLKVLLQVAAEAVRQVVAEFYPGVQIGMIYTVHTFGRDLGFKPHVHLVMTKGGLKDGGWVDVDYIPGGKLAAKWRFLLMSKAPPAATSRYPFARNDQQPLSSAPGLSGPHG